MFHELESNYLKIGSIWTNLCKVIHGVICTQKTKFRPPVSNGSRGEGI
jgi:hypothetical protein